MSSQIGCAVNCQFCLTAKLGIIRNLTAGEIAGQVVAVLKRHAVQTGRDRINLVFMGMGEPFLNYDAFMDAVRLLGSRDRHRRIAHDRLHLRHHARHPALRRRTRDGPSSPSPSMRSNDKVREQIMPITRKWDIQHLFNAVRKVPLRASERSPSNMFC